MPKEVKIVDRTMRKRPGTNEMMKDPNNYNPIHTEKTTVVKKGNAIKKKVVGINRQGGIYEGKPDNEKSVDISKYDKSGKLKKKVSLVKDDSGIIKKTVSRPGKKDVTSKGGLLASSRIKKYI